MVTTILGGCGSKKEATAVSAPQNAGATTQQTSLQKIDITKQQGQTEVDKGLDQHAA